MSMTRYAYDKKVDLLYEKARERCVGALLFGEQVNHNDPRQVAASMYALYLNSDRQMRPCEQLLALEDS